jgi:hypothetical protein
MARRISRVAACSSASVALGLGARRLGRQRHLALAQGGVLVAGRRIERPQLLKLRQELVNGGKIVGHGGARIPRAPRLVL